MPGGLADADIIAGEQAAFSCPVGGFFA